MSVPVFLKIDKASEPFSVQGSMMSQGDFSRLEGVSEIEGDIIKLSLEDFGYKAELGDVEGLSAVSIRYKDGNIQVFLLYMDAEKTARSACCISETNGTSCECYASVSCSC